jgi:hypothetical protein
MKNLFLLIGRKRLDTTTPQPARLALLGSALIVGLSACAPSFVPVRLDEPIGARVRFEGENRAEGTTPLVARLEQGSPLFQGIPIELELDAAQAARYGHEGAVRIYGRINIGRVPWFTHNLPVRVSPGEEQLRSLLRGEIDRVYVATCDTSPCGGGACERARCHGKQILATIELQLTPLHQ